MAPKPKGILALSIKMKPKPGEKPEGDEQSDSPLPEGDDEYGAGREAAASEVLSAMKSNDPAALAEALKSFMDMC